MRSLFRGLLRASVRIDKAAECGTTGATNSSGGNGLLTDLLGTVTLPAGTPRFGVAVSARNIVRHNFKAHVKYSASSDDTKELVDLAFSALRTVNRKLNPPPAAQVHEADVASAAAAVSKPASVLFSVGHVIRHKQYGYRGVVVGWHEACKASTNWAEANKIGLLPHGTAQPFYLVLVDVRDRPDAQVSYVAQDNVELLSGQGLQGGGEPSPTPSCLVSHPSIASHFASFLPSAGVYVPAEQLAAQFPTDSPLTNLASLSSVAQRVRAEEADGAGSPKGNRRARV